MKQQQLENVRLAVVTNPPASLLSNVEEDKLAIATEFGAYPRQAPAESLENVLDWAFQARWQEHVFGLLMEQLIVPIGLVNGQFAFLPAAPSVPRNTIKVQSPKDLEKRLIKVARHGAKMVNTSAFDSFMGDFLDWVEKATNNKLDLSRILAGDLLVQTDPRITFRSLSELPHNARKAFKRQFRDRSIGQLVVPQNCDATAMQNGDA